MPAWAHMLGLQKSICSAENLKYEFLGFEGGGLGGDVFAEHASRPEFRSPAPTYKAGEVVWVFMLSRQAIY